MRRRGAVLAGLLLLGGTGCLGIFDASEGTPALLTALPRELTAPEAHVLAASNGFGFALFHEARQAQPDANIFLSPISATLALAMTLNGAAGTTEASMRVALQLGGASFAELNAGYRSLIDLLRGLDGTGEFRIANSIWSDQGFPFFEAFLDSARTYFDALVQSLDLQAPASLGTINDWVKQQTAGKIPTILDQVQQDEVMFLINAIYFKGRWRKAFDPKHTAPAPFHAADGTTQSVPTMSLEATELRHADRPEAQLVELLYGNGAFALTIVLPNPGRTLAGVVAGLDAARWAEWTAAIRESKFALTLPKFRLEYKRELKDDLTALGMGIAFDDQRADFSRLGSRALGNLFLTRVTQKTFVDVNEEGTEAAAATSVGVGVTSAPPTIVVNRPFLFVLRERLSGTIFFIGQINKVPG